MAKNLTILVNSCDKYEDAWNPFFKLFCIMWPNCPYDIVLNTETKDYQCPYLNVRTLLGGAGIPWAKRLKNALLQIETDYILYFLEDFFLMSPVNVDSFNTAFDLIQKDTTIGYIGLKKNLSHIFKNPECASLYSKTAFLSKDDLIKANRVNSMTALWRRSWLLALIKEHETPWEFEIYASIRSRRTPEKVLIINNQVLPPVFDYQVDIQYGYGISLSSWLPKNKELFDKYGIEVNYERLGWYGSKNDEQKKQIEAPNNTIFSMLSSIKETLYRFKWYLKQFKKRVRKEYRRYLSLH